MATTKNIKLYGTLGTAVGKPITTTDEIYDDKQLKNQEDINADLYKKVNKQNYTDVTKYNTPGSKMPYDGLFTFDGIPTEVFRYTDGPDDTDNQLWVLTNGIEPVGSNNRDVRTVYVYTLVTEGSTKYWKYVGDANLDSYTETNKNIGSSEEIYFSEDVFDLMKCVFGRKNEFYDDIQNIIDNASGDSSINHAGIGLTICKQPYDPYFDSPDEKIMSASCSNAEGIMYSELDHKFVESKKLLMYFPDIPYATSTSAGVMSKEDKAKLDSITFGADGSLEAACILNVTYTSTANDATLSVVDAGNTPHNATITAATTSNAGLLTASDKKSLDTISAFKFEIKNGVLTLVSGEDTYCVSLTPYTTPTAPSISGAGTFNLTVGSKATAVITNKDSRTCVINYNDGSAKSATVEPGKTITITITSTGENESSRYPITATAVCNGLSSNQTLIEIIIKRQVATPVVVIGGDKYDKVRTVTATCPTSGSTIKYSNNGGSSWNDLDGSGLTINTTTSTRSLAFCATASEWVNSDNAYNDSSIIVGAKPVYVGFGASTLADETAITSMEGVQKVKKDTPVGTYTVTNTNKGVYLWICSAGTLTSVKSSGFAVPMEAMQTIDGYKCYRSSSAVLITGAQTFEVA